MVAFLLPLVAAIAGSLMGGDGNGRIIGAIVGLLAGLAAAILLGRIMNRPVGMDGDKTNQYQVDTSEHTETYGDSNSHKRQADL
jgi:tetrahydromethanopterin S-methyltransferase subunit C